jgi:hypothetical protein
MMNRMPIEKVKNSTPPCTAKCARVGLRFHQPKASFVIEPAGSLFWIDSFTMEGHGMKSQPHGWWGGVFDLLYDCRPTSCCGHAPRPIESRFCEEGSPSGYTFTLCRILPAQE